MTTASQQTRSHHLDDEERRELFDIVTARSFRRGLFKLSSGGESTLYFNLKPTMMSPRGAYLAAKSFLDVLERERADYVGGLEMGAVPMIGAVAALGEAEGRPVKTFFVRKQAKDHGTRDLVEGLGPDETLGGRRVVVADDVATSGASLWRAIEAAREAGGQVDCALVLVNREEGAAEFLADRGVRLVTVFSASQFA
ncbi:MAG: orotate phosphoribosyltransferase [Pseudomonadota bacterium]|nr:orotate phosphoribosyltransferase [Pseudomonadota bacterium]